MNEDQILGWLLHQKKHAEIPEVTDEMIEKLVETSPYMAVLFCKQSIRFSISPFNNLPQLFVKSVSLYAAKEIN